MEIDFQIGVETLRIERLRIAVGRIVAVQTEQVFIVVRNSVAVGVGRCPGNFFVGSRQRRIAAFVVLRVDDAVPAAGKTGRGRRRGL